MFDDSRTNTQLPRLEKSRKNCKWSYGDATSGILQQPVARKICFPKKKKKERAWLQSAAWSKDLSKNLAEQSLFRFAFEPKSSLIRRCHISRGDKGRKVITARGNGYTQPSPTRLLVFPYREMRGWEAFPFCGRLRAFPAQKSRTSSHVEFDRIAENWWNSFEIYISRSS